MPTFFIKHITKYSYSNPVIDGANLIRLHPIDDEYQKVASHFISVTNNPFIETYIDFYNNRVGTFVISEPHDELSIISEVEVTTKDKLFPDDSEAVKTQWDEINSIKYDANIYDFFKYISLTDMKILIFMFKGSISKHNEKKTIAHHLSLARPLQKIFFGFI